MDKTLLSLGQSSHTNTLEYASDSEKEHVSFNGSSVKNEPDLFRFNIEDLSRYPSKSNRSGIKNRKAQIEIKKKKKVSAEDILQGDVLENLFHEQGEFNSRFLRGQEQGKSPASKIINQKKAKSTENVCYCSKVNPKSKCKLPDVFTPKQRSDTTTRHIPDNTLAPDHLKRIGIEIETAGLEFMNTTPWFKGQILARTTGECFGYPLISVTAELSPSETACLELVTAPLTETQLHSYHIDQKLKKLKELFADDQCSKQLGKVIIAYNNYISDFFNDSSQIDLMAISPYKQCLPYKGNIKIEAAVVSLSQKHEIGETAIMKTGALKTPISWFHQHNFFIPYSNLGSLCKTIINENNSNGVKNEIGKLEKTEELTKIINSIFQEFEGIDDVDRNEINAFSTNHAYIAFRYFCRLSHIPEVKKSYLYSIRYSCFSTKISLHQEMLEILSDKTIEFFNTNAEKNKGTKIPERLMEKIINLHSSFK
nr:hypothetical protein [Endozoicomonas sp.]